MAQTICFLDGTYEVLLCGDDADLERAALERILLERLGDDVVQLFHSVLTPAEPPDDYERACDDYRTCLQDALDALQELKFRLEIPRSNRGAILRSVEKMITLINNVL